MALSAFFDNGITIPNGVAFFASPFNSVFVLDYYDGVTEAFAESNMSHICYIKQLWWDDKQNYRIFSVSILDLTSSNIFRNKMKGDFENIIGSNIFNYKGSAQINLSERYLENTSYEYECYAFCLHINKEVCLFERID